MLVAFGGAQTRTLDPLKAPALLLNLAGAGLVLVSLTHKFNLGAFILEAAWALVAAYGLIRLALSPKR